MIEIRNLWKTYKPKKGQPVQALKGVNLTIEDRGMVFILGKSGSGKSTLLHLLGGLDIYDSGELIIKGKSSSAFKQSDFDSYRNTLVGFIFQDYNILDEFNVGKNIELALELQGQKFNKGQVEKSLEEVGLEGYYNRKPNELSGGQKQRVAIARALIKNPEIIMADEPTGALDSKTGIQVFNTLKTLSRNKLVIVVSHDRDFAEQYADRIIELADGQIISDVQKYKTQPKEIVAGVNIIDDKAIIIKQGHTITMSEFYYITKIFNSITKNSDAVVPISSASTKEVKKTLKLADDGSSTYFDQTNIYSLPIKQYGYNDLTLKKSRMPLKDSIKMGASALKYKKFRLFLTILLSSIAFAMFGFVSTISSYNLVDATYRSLIESNINYISVSKSVKNSEYDYFEQKGFSQKDITSIKAKQDRDYVGIYTFGKFEGYSSGISYGGYLKDSSRADYYYNSSFSGLSNITQAQAENFGFTLLEGRLPKDVEAGKNPEVAITDVQLEIFQKLGYRGYAASSTDSIETKITSAKDLINKTIGFSDFINGDYVQLNLTIVGVIDTKFDSTRYDPLKIENANYDFSTQLLNGEIRTVMSSSLNNACYVTKSFLSTYSSDTIYLVTKTDSKTTDTELLNYFIKYKTDDTKYTINNAASFTLNNFDDILKQMASVFLYIGIGFAVFASLLLFNFITTSISYKKREIGILRAVGARSTDVFGIFFNESLIIALINSILAILISGGAVIFLNSYMRSQGLLVSLISFGLLQILLIVGVAILAAFISTILPVSKIARKKPIDAIRNK